jgi:uncharacterized membrane protein
MTPDPFSSRYPSSTGLSPTVAAILAYSGWWVTGAIFWWLERRDRRVRLHAAQALIAFGALALLIAVFIALAVVSLSFAPGMFAFFAGAAALTWVVGVALWGVAIWRAGRGDEWRIPVAAQWADRLNRSRASAAASP